MGYWKHLIDNWCFLTFDPDSHKRILFHMTLPTAEGKNNPKLQDFIDYSD
jgi:hypothetical protein